MSITSMYIYNLSIRYLFLSKSFLELVFRNARKKMFSKFYHLVIIELIIIVHHYFLLNIFTVQQVQYAYYSEHTALPVFFLQSSFVCIHLVVIYFIPVSRNAIFVYLIILITSVKYVFWVELIPKVRYFIYQVIHWIVLLYLLSFLFSLVGFPVYYFLVYFHLLLY